MGCNKREWVKNFRFSEIKFFYVRKQSIPGSVSISRMFSVSLLISLSCLGCGSEVAEKKSEQVPIYQAVNEKPSVQVEKENQLFQPDRKTGAEWTRATDLYGPVVVSEGNAWADVEFSPWSAQWYPAVEDRLFRESHSPLQKYDEYVGKLKGTRGKAAEYEEKVIYRPDGSVWSGRCHAWSLASVLEPDPAIRNSVTLEGVTFTSGDLRALLTMTYDKVEGIDGHEGLIQFGQRNNNDEQNVMEDIYPDQFHRVIQKELFEKRRPVIMDKDPGVEVLNVPVHKAEISITKDRNDPYVVHVETALVATDPLDPRSDPDLVRNKRVVFNYTYDLYGYPQLNGSLNVIYGLWTGSSIKDHPDFLWAVPNKINLKRSSKNAELDVSIVDEIIKRSKQ